MLCVTFDIDDTLYLERDYVQSGFAAVDAWAAANLGLPGLGARCGALFEAGARGNIFDRALAAAGVRASAETIGALVAVYRDHVPDIALAADAEAALGALAPVAEMAVLSDGPVASQSRKVAALGLARYCRHIVLTEALGAEFRKPSARGFERIMQLYPGARHVYVGDNPAKDFQAPRQLGWTTVRVRRPRGLHFAVPSAEVDYEVAECGPLPALLAGVARAAEGDGMSGALRSAAKAAGASRPEAGR